MPFRRLTRRLLDQSQSELEAGDSEMMSTDMDVEVSVSQTPEASTSLAQGPQHKSIRVQFLTTKQVRTPLELPLSAMPLV